MIALGSLLLFFSGVGRVENTEAKATPAELAALVRETKTAVIVFEEYRPKRVTLEVAVTDPAWIDALAELVERGPLPPRKSCFCVSNPRIELYGSNRGTADLSIHHDAYLRSFGVVEGNFEIGAERGQAILELARRYRAQAREPVLPRPR